MPTSRREFLALATCGSQAAATAQSHRQGGSARSAGTRSPGFFQPEEVATLPAVAPALRSSEPLVDRLRRGEL